MANIQAALNGHYGASLYRLVAHGVRFDYHLAREKLLGACYYILKIRRCCVVTMLADGRLIVSRTARCLRAAQLPTDVHSALVLCAA